jgi:hypothetical protein
LNLAAGRLTVPNIESRCNQLKLGHPPFIKTEASQNKYNFGVLLVLHN